MGEIRRFQIAECAAEDVQRLQRELGVSAAMAQVLVRRGQSDPAGARAFLAAEEEYPSSAFAGIERAIALVLEHVRLRRRITVHGDYDVDGMCSTAVLVRVLRALGADVDWYLPDRASDGYGLNANTVERLAQRGTQLLITADCAITAVAEVALARTLGMQVLVTDHHAVRADGELPGAPIVHPAVCGYPCVDLCATAVAYKLAQALWEAAGAQRRQTDAQAGAMQAPGESERNRLERGGYRPQDDLDLVALATIADVVALTGENRTLVRRGLRALASTAKPGLRALMAVAQVDPSRVGERAVGFALAPRLNAAGRLYRADAGLELILTEDPGRASQIAQELDRANQERRHTETRILFEAEAQVAALGERPAYVLAGEGWHPGVIGIVASRLADRHHRPIVMISLDGERGRGSGRSIEGFDLLGGLQDCAAHLARHGGHRAAAGLELERSCLEAFREAFVAHAQQILSAEQLVRGERVDAVLECHELGMVLAEELQTLAPFGASNPTVSLLVRGATLSDRRPMGEGRHLRFTVLSSDGARARAVAFGNGGRLPVAEEVLADATFTLEVNEWKGVSEPRLLLRHAQPAGDQAKRTEVAAVPAAELALFALP
ncbi:MAG TPA: single-stranded-DNA-specific exonuclease RecJ [Solirubrobacteraceae bacterium]|jgi:single-stranded-DNA-specific exonuclease